MLGKSYMRMGIGLVIRSSGLTERDLFTSDFRANSDEDFLRIVM